jgi:leader peptidase (prepilin peptidase)/N-methyltransferase
MAASSMQSRIAAHGGAAAAIAAGGALSLYLLPLPASVFAALLAAIAVVIAVVDLEYLVIPDLANAALLVLGAVLVVIDAPAGGVPAALLHAAARLVVAGGALLLLRYVYWRRTGVEGLGLGDAKLAAAGAPLLAWATLPVALLIASAGGLLAVASRSLMARRRPDRSAEIPFGAFLAPAIWLAFVLERSGTLVF